MTSLRDAAQQEPVAWMVYTLDGKSVCVTDNPNDFTEQHKALPLYTAPPRCPNCASLEAQNTELDRKLEELERKPMNEFDALRLVTENVGLLQSAGPVEGLIGIIRAVERAHGIGEKE